MKKILFFLFLIPIAGFSQNKKEQIATLNFKLDSLNNKISNERQESKKEIEENEKKISSQKAQLIKLYDRVKKLNESLESEKANLNTQKLKNIEFEKLNNKYEQEIGKLNESQESLSAANIQLKESLNSLDSIYNLLTISYDSVIKNKVDTKTDSLDNYLKYFKSGFSLRETNIENIPSNLDYSYNYAEVVEAYSDEDGNLYGADGLPLDDNYPENNILPPYFDAQENRIYIIGYNENESLMYLEIRETLYDYFDFNSATLFTQSLTNNKIQSILHLTDDGYEGIEDWIIVKQEEDLWSDDSEEIKVDTNDFNYFLPKIFIQKMNEHILSNNIIPFGAGKLINSNKVYYIDNGKNLKINFVESQIGDNYKLTALNGDYNKLLFSKNLTKASEDEADEIVYDESYKFLGYFELPGTDYLGLLLMHTTFDGCLDCIQEYLEIISYKYK